MKEKGNLEREIDRALEKAEYTDDPEVAKDENDKAGNIGIDLNDLNGEISEKEARVKQLERFLCFFFIFFFCEFVVVFISINVSNQNTLLIFKMTWDLKEIAELVLFIKATTI